METRFWMYSTFFFERRRTKTRAKEAIVSISNAISIIAQINDQSCVNKGRGRDGTCVRQICEKLTTLSEAVWCLQDQDQMLGTLIPLRMSLLWKSPAEKAQTAIIVREAVNAKIALAVLRRFAHVTDLRYERRTTIS